MYQESLNTLANVAGCFGACLLDSRGNVVAHRLSPPYEPVLMTGALAQISIAIEMYASLESHPSPKVFVARFEEGTLVVRWLDGFVVMALGAPNLNTAILLVALNALSMKLANAPAGRPAASAASMAPLASVPPERSIAPLSSLAPSMAPSGTGRTVPVDTVRQVSAELAKSLGPLSVSVVKREAQKLGFDARTLPWERFGEWVDALGEQISDPTARRAFVSASKKLA